MQFLEFMNLLEDLTQVVEADTVDWDPMATAAYKGSPGITRDTSSTMRQQVMTRAKPKTGDIVIVKDQAGKVTPGVIGDIEQDTAMIINTKMGLRLKRPLSALAPAPPAMTNQLAGRFPGKSIYMYDPNSNQIPWLST